MLRRVLAGLLGLALAAPLPAQSSVWRVTRGSRTLYLGGTIHLLRAEDFPLPPEFDAAFDASRKIVFETDIARMQSDELQNVIATQGTFKDGKTLQRVLTPETWRSVEAYCQRTGLPLSRVSHLKPWLFTVMLAGIELRKLGISSDGADLHFHHLATARGKKTGELETFEHHIAYITRLGAGHESEMVAKSLEDVDDIPEIMNKLLAAWRVGDIAQIDELMIREMREKYPSILQDLLVSRNEAWLPKIEALLNTPEVEFVLVGAGHLAGKEGLLERLRAHGCRLEQINASSPARR